MYCSFWGLYSNFLSYDQEQVRSKILNLFGLKLENRRISNSTNLISLIKEKIDCENPIIINVPDSVLFYSIMYKDPNTRRMNHSFIINGYDDSKNIFYIRENCINSGVLSILTSSQPFSEYCITYNMLEDIYNKTNELLENKDEINKFFQFMICEKEINIDNLIIKFINDCINSFDSSKDLFYNIIEQIQDENKYDLVFSNEQFRRTMIHSLKAVFDEIKKLLPTEYISDFIKLSNDYLKHREKIVNIISKNVIKNSKINKDSLKVFLDDLNSYNKKIALFCKKINYKENVQHNKVKNLLDGVIVTADSERLDDGRLYPAKNVLSELRVNNHFNYWISDDSTRKHWLKIEFNRVVHINKIVIAHLTNIKCITKNYKLSISLDGKKWKSIMSVKNNNEVFNEFNFKNAISFRFFKININEPNSGIDNYARISKIDFFVNN